MVTLTLPVQPGLLSSFYFIVFDLFFLAIVDITLARFVCSGYYRRIFTGRPVRIQSSDIPGVTTYLLDSPLILPNLLAISIKFLFLAGIFYVDLQIKSRSTHPLQQELRTGTYDFDPSPEQWQFGQRHFRSVARRWDHQRLCRKANYTTNDVTFYHLAFDLQNKRVVEDEVVTSSPDKLIKVDDQSIICLSEDNVNKSVPLARVLGCSRFQAEGSCVREQKVELQTSITFPSIPWTFTKEIGSGDVKYELILVDEREAQAYLPDYTKPNLTCTRIDVGLDEFDTRRFSYCIVYSYTEAGNTLVERWEFNETSKIMTRYYPGPVFSGIHKFDFTRITGMLSYIVQRLDWESFSGVIIADNIVYRRNTFTVLEKKPARIMTDVTLIPLIVASAILLGVVLLRVAFWFTIAGDPRPQVNTIDGLSSIAREEQLPSGGSLREGRGCFVGLFALGDNGTEPSGEAEGYDSTEQRDGEGEGRGGKWREGSELRLRSNIAEFSRRDPTRFAR